MERIDAVGPFDVDGACRRALYEDGTASKSARQVVDQRIWQVAATQQQHVHADRLHRPRSDSDRCHRNGGGLRK
jgi:hypothetical protein